MMFKAMLMDADRSRRLDTCIVPLPLNKVRRPLFFFFRFSSATGRCRCCYKSFPHSTTTFTPTSLLHWALFRQNQSELESTKKMHIAYMTGESYFTPAPASRRAVEVAVGALRALGHTVTPFSDALLDTWMTTFVSYVARPGLWAGVSPAASSAVPRCALPESRCNVAPAHFTKGQGFALSDSSRPPLSPRPHLTAS